MQFDVKSGYVDRFALKRNVFPPSESRPGTFVTLEITGEREGDRHPPKVCLYFDKPSDLDSLIAEATALRADFVRQIAADGEAAQAARAFPVLRPVTQTVVMPTPEALGHEHETDAHQDSAPVA